jgi:hypothetical protein
MRSYAHMSNERLDPDNEKWVLEVLIPKLNSESGLTWSLGTQHTNQNLPNDLLVSNKCFMQIPYTILDLDDIPPAFNLQNTSIKIIQKLYPTLKDENIGYYIIDEKDYGRNKTRKWPKEVRDFNLCWGYFALDITPILERGKTMAKRFGI